MGTKPNRTLGLVFVVEILITASFMLQSIDKRFYLLDLTALFVAKNKEFTQAVKEKRPAAELAVLHSELQEIFNHISFLRQQEAA